MTNSIDYTELELTDDVFMDLSTVLSQAGYTIQTSHRLIYMAIEQNPYAILMIAMAIQKVCH